ncbi:CHAD domain-containing protein [Agrobacterium rubi]|nr:CHAD domain-containing protein [Agrobacterium rubi]NTF22195.1 CHAD domain-containing protein [Agrobacterium rubi]NTF29052.1 CHAD domain-containing protein [Agrobacterium rubi]
MNYTDLTGVQQSSITPRSVALAEVELKLEIDAAGFERLMSSNLLGDPDETVQQTSTYFDTSDNAFFAEGFTLRIRKVGDARTQTVKATGPSASIFARSEWETAVTGDTPVIDMTSPLINEFGDQANNVWPKFDVVNERRIWNVTENGSNIEVALDRGSVRSVDREAPIIELELELKDGKPEDLFSLARKIEGIVPVRFGVLSKAERGFRLLEAERAVVKADPVELDRGASACQAFQTIASSCFRQFRLNETILRSRRNEDSLHQARVALRRLRSAITLFRPMLQDDEAKRLSAEFRWLADVLGEARNIDVLLPKAEAGELRDTLAEKRTAAYDNVIEALDSSRARALMLDYNEWLHCGDYLSDAATTDARERPAGQFAGEALDKARKKLKKHGQDLSGVDDEHRHEARKDAKKLRYAAEFFRSLFPDKRGMRRYKRFVVAMEALQDELGALNDLATGPEVLDEHGLRGLAGADDLIVHADKAKLIRAAQEALDDVLDAKRFWR